MQLFSATKGSLPLELLAPVPTPIGDFSMINILLWLSDALLLVCCLGAPLTYYTAVFGVTLGGLVSLITLGLVMLYFANRRMKRLIMPD
jgi:hypothetical protein